MGKRKSADTNDSVNNSKDNANDYEIISSINLPLLEIFSAIKVIFVELSFLAEIL